MRVRWDSPEGGGGGVGGGGKDGSGGKDCQPGGGPSSSSASAMSSSLLAILVDSLSQEASKRDFFVNEIYNAVLVSFTTSINNNGYGFSRYEFFFFFEHDV